MDIDERMERTLWDLFWLPPWASVVDRPEILYTRSDRDLYFLNQVLRVRAPATRVDALVAEVSEAYAAVTSRWMLTAASTSPALEAALPRAGFARDHTHHAYVVASAAYDRRPPAGVEALPVDRPERLVAAIRTSERAFGHPSSVIDEDRVADELSQLTRPDARVHRFVAVDRDGAPLAAGGLNLFPDLGLGVLWGAGTVPEARGRGAYTALVAARVQTARRLGCPLVGIYAREGTSAPIVARQGFQRHGPMVTWRRSAPAVPATAGEAAAPPAPAPAPTRSPG